LTWLAKLAEAREPMDGQAILAPVPADLLEDGLDQGYRRVAFGSMAWEFFRRLSDDVGDDPLPVSCSTRRTPAPLPSR
jgi:hypothetical protein